MSRQTEPMQLVVVLLNDEEYREEVNLALTTVSGGFVTMIDAVSGAQNLSQSIPLFAHFMNHRSSPMSKLFLTCASGDDLGGEFLTALNQAGIDFIEDKLGEIYVIPLSAAYLIDEELTL